MSFTVLQEMAARSRHDHAGWYNYRDVLLVDFADHEALFRRGLEQIGAECGRPGLFEEVAEECAAGQSFPFLAGDGFFVLSPFIRDGETVVRVVAAYSPTSADAIARYIGAVQHLAEEIGAKRLQFWTARRGFERVAPRIGFTKAFTVWERSL